MESSNANRTSEEVESAPVLPALDLFPLQQGEELYIVKGSRSADVRPSAQPGFAWLSVVDLAKNEESFLKKPVALKSIPWVLEHLGIVVGDAVGRKTQGKECRECPFTRDPSAPAASEASR